MCKETKCSQCNYIVPHYCHIPNITSDESAWRCPRCGWINVFNDDKAQLKAYWECVQCGNVIEEGDCVLVNDVRKGWSCPKCGTINNIPKALSTSQEEKDVRSILNANGGKDGGKDGGTVSVGNDLKGDFPVGNNQMFLGKCPKKGKKFDTTKLRTDLLPLSALTQLAEVLGFGAIKYGDNNWKSGLDYNRLYGATLRHLFAWWGGEVNDPESGLPHLSHAMCNIAFLTEYEANRSRYDKFDNKPKG